MTKTLTDYENDVEWVRDKYSDHFQIDPTCDCSFCTLFAAFDAMKADRDERIKAMTEAAECLESLDYLLANQNPEIDWESVRTCVRALKEPTDDE